LRAIPALNKVGKPYIDTKKKFVGKFTYEDGDFLRKTRAHLDDSHSSLVVDVDGVRGIAKVRNLQKIHEPWGLPAVLPMKKMDNDAAEEISSDDDSSDDSDEEPQTRAHLKNLKVVELKQMAAKNGWAVPASGKQLSAYYFIFHDL